MPACVHGSYSSASAHGDRGQARTQSANCIHSRDPNAQDDHWSSRPAATDAIDQAAGLEASSYSCAIHTSGSSSLISGVLSRGGSGRFNAAQDTAYAENSVTG